MPVCKVWTNKTGIYLISCGVKMSLDIESIKMKRELRLLFF